MTVASLTILIIAGALAACGVYLILERTLTRIFIGLSLLTHGINVLLLSSGGQAGRPPLLAWEKATAMADPVPQALILTSIVLSFGTTAFGLALAYRQWRLTGHDEVVDDVEDRRVFNRAAEEAAIDVVDDDAATGDEDAGINYDQSEDKDGDGIPEDDADGAPGPVLVNKDDTGGDRR